MFCCANARVRALLAYIYKMTRRHAPRDVRASLNCCYLCGCCNTTYMRIYEYNCTKVQFGSTHIHTHSLTTICPLLCFDPRGLLKNDLFHQFNLNSFLPVICVRGCVCVLNGTIHVFIYLFICTYV